MKNTLKKFLRSGAAALCVFLLLMTCTGCGGKADISEYGDAKIAISGLADKEFTVTPNELAQLKCVDESDSGETAKAGTVSVRGPTLSTFLAQYDKKTSDFERIRFIASDEYRVVLREADLAKFDVILGVSSGSKALDKSERPLRILIPGDDSSSWEYACVRIEFVAKAK